MATILDLILSQKSIEIERLKMLKMQKTTAEHKHHSFISVLKNASELSIIAEFKRASPSKGDINAGLIPAEQASKYIQFGANAVSVLTDKVFFKGCIEDLEDVRKTIDAPILCKDFIIDSVQIDMAKRAGADIILLITAAMSTEKMLSLYQYAIDQGLEVLIEVHNETELERALKTGGRLIGVNNRDLKTFEVDLSVTERLASKVKESGAFLISESGIRTLEDVKRVVDAGANGILVGETFMKSESLADTIQQMKLSLREKAL
nr:indole-3-glycerol phosphate synthase TrpC [uncultured Bacillus sp.]